MLIDREICDILVRAGPGPSCDLIYFVYAMGIASVFYIIANLIFEIIIPLFQKA